MPEESTFQEAPFKWKGWRWALISFAMSIGHAVLWAVVWNGVYMAFLAFGLIKK